MCPSFVAFLSQIYSRMSHASWCGVLIFTVLLPVRLLLNLHNATYTALAAVRCWFPWSPAFCCSGNHEDQQCSRWQRVSQGPISRVQSQQATTKVQTASINKAISDGTDTNTHPGVKQETEPEDCTGMSQERRWNNSQSRSRTVSTKPTQSHKQNRRYKGLEAQNARQERPRIPTTFPGIEPVKVNLLAPNYILSLLQPWFQGIW